MGWAKFDDAFSDHPKVVAAGPMAELLHVRAILFCARYETDGHVPESQLHRIALGIKQASRHVTRLLEVGLWEKHQDGDGWWVHDYLEYNPSSEEKQLRRKQAAERMQRARERHENGRRTDARGSPGVRPTPARPEVLSEPTARGRDAPRRAVDNQAVRSVAARPTCRWCSAYLSPTHTEDGCHLRPEEPS